MENNGANKDRGGEIQSFALYPPFLMRKKKEMYGTNI